MSFEHQFLGVGQTAFESNFQRNHSIQMIRVGTKVSVHDWKRGK
jgi:hypothetical protein